MNNNYKKIIPLRFHNASYEKDVSDKIKEIVLEQIKKRDGIYFVGDSGVGKTHIVCALVKYLVDIEKLPVIFYNTGDLMEKLREEFKTDSEEFGLLRKLMNFKGILILDDIGSEKPSDWTRERLYLILNNRYEEMFPVIFTSNCDLDSLALQVGDRITSRVKGMCKILRVEGEDKRLK